jgi:hypothetical protein
MSPPGVGEGTKKGEALPVTVRVRGRDVTQACQFIPSVP